MRSNKLTAVSRIIGALLLGIFVLMIGSSLIMLFHITPQVLASKPWLGGVIIHTTMLILSLLIILVLCKGNISSYGLKISKKMYLKQVILYSIIIGTIAAIIQSLLPSAASSPFAYFSFLETIIFIWLYASICEEMLTRGLMQGFLEPTRRYGIYIRHLRISIPVLFPALFFALIHLVPFANSMQLPALLFFLLTAFILGIFAGYYREKSGSIVPAIIVHTLFNVSGSLVELFVD